ncbi:endonuclease/exonuclease/phosphatase family protein [Hyphomonas neptunium ATCC 15444]|uniref:Endonuclease/exonuclease/phosphatase family protein n=2 Tax=Hyphomonas TaxID=85 RepID=Q0BYP6_HYPNA|nr:MULTISPECIES: endonuclease/exonuclease/phosphatase family protein [Hyphomonas]ABI77607.1 endonuclease/exonuclease/phosphatase family protein [Hyphomonas neptunium ATCC 15444]KCZ91524.1 endonuclease/exonuclease/phosphatase family protein [Hyphomonas hirschiana VP5]
MWLRRSLVYVSLLVMLAVLWLGVAIFVTLNDRGIPERRVEVAEPLPAAEAPLKLMIWNIGYSGLGEESDFQTDGGKMLRPPSREAVEKNLAGIQAVLREEAPDILMMQELAAPGFLTHTVDVLSGVKDALPGYGMVFSSDIRTRLLPGPLGLRHGLGTFAKVAGERTKLVRLTEEPEPIMGFIQRRYHVQVTELEVSGAPWVIINVHLSAFDEGAGTRMQQVREVLDLAQSHYQQGKAVVLGGDWNMRLAATDFAYQSDESALFWVHDFPRDALRPGWQIVIDPAVATTRTNEQPYKSGVNYTTIIDGFIASPNVTVEAVRGLDLGFAITDHQPVVATFRLAGPETEEPAAPAE